VVQHNKRVWGSSSPTAVGLSLLRSSSSCALRKMSTVSCDAPAGVPLCAIWTDRWSNPRIVGLKFVTHDCHQKLHRPLNARRFARLVVEGFANIPRRPLRILRLGQLAKDLLMAAVSIELTPDGRSNRKLSTQQGVCFASANFRLPTTRQCRTINLHRKRCLASYAFMTSPMV
jgi:hypothetical protein